MTVPTLDGYDITSGQFAHRPTKAGLVPAFYSTGSSDIRMTQAMSNMFPHAIRIDQANGADDTADFFDVEPGCYTPAQVAVRVKAAIASFNANRRPGQRWPAVYASRHNSPYSIADVITALTNAGLHNSGIGLIIADWNNNHAAAQAEVANSLPGAANNPFPVVGRQYQNAGPYDLDVWSQVWLDRVSGAVNPPPPPPPPIHTVSVLGKTLPVLTVGMSDAHLPHWYVRRVQSVLNAVYGQHLQVDGVYGSATAAAVSAVHPASLGKVDHDVWDQIFIPGL